MYFPDGQVEFRIPRRVVERLHRAAAVARRFMCDARCPVETGEFEALLDLIH